MQTVQNHHTPTPQAAYPQYGDQPHKPGLYLGLLHGRNDPADQMNDWGFNGPAIGPLNWVHTTYACDIKIEFENPEDAEVYFEEGRKFQELKLDEDLLVFDGKYYGDYTVYYVKAEDCGPPTDTFRQNPRRGNQCTHRRCL